MKSIIAAVCIFWICWGPQPLWGTTLESQIKHPTLLTAWDLLKTGNKQECLKKLSKFTPNPETNLSFHFLYGRALEKSDKALEALEHYRSAYLYAPPGDLKELAMLERADCHLRIGQYNEAKLAYSFFLGAFSKSKYLDRANLGIARSLTALKQMQQALPYFEKAGEDLEAIWGRAVAFNRMGRFKESNDNFLKGIGRDKVAFLNSEELLFYYGDNLHHLGKGQEATTYLSAEMKDPVFRKKADLNLGVIAQRTGKLEEAKKYFESALGAPDRLTKQEALFQLAEVQTGLGRKNEARQRYREYLLKYPDGKTAEDVLIKLARMDMEEGRLDQAGKWMKRLGQYASLKNETMQETEQFFLKLKEKDPSQIVYYWKALGKKFTDKSRETFLLTILDSLKGSGRPYLDLLQWLSVNGSESAKLRSRLSLTHYQAETGNLDAALAGFKSFKDNKSQVSSDEILRLEAKILLQKGEYRAAWDCLHSLKKVVLQDLPLMEETVSWAKDRARAIDFYDKAVQRLGGNADSYLKLGDLFYERGRTKEALMTYQKALEKDPLNEWGLFRAASLSNGAEAQQLLERVKKGNSLLGRLAEISLKEKEAARKIGEMF
jgi:tetratricopeptide (TPR) repeat protein